MSMKALLAAFLAALPLHCFAQVTGGSTAPSTPGTTRNIPGTTGTIQGTTPTVPGTTGTIPGTAGNIPGTTQTPTADGPQPLERRPPASGIPDLRDDNTNISGRFESLDKGSIFDTREFNTLTGNGESIFIDDRASVFAEGPPGGEEGFAIGPETPSTLDNGIFKDDLTEDTVIP